MNLEEIKLSEGFRSTAYKRNGDVWTYGYGSTYKTDNTRVKQGDTITRQDAELLLKTKIEKEYLPQLKSLIKSNLNDNQRDALLSLIYNIGAGNLKKSPLLKIINIDSNSAVIKGVWEITNIRVGSQFEKGLRARRKREVELYFKAI